MSSTHYYLPFLDRTQLRLAYLYSLSLIKVLGKITEVLVGSGRGFDFVFKIQRVSHQYYQ